MAFKPRKQVTVTDSPDAPGLVGRTGTAYPTRDGLIEVEGIRDPKIDERFGTAPKFRPDQVREV